jgi:hypothetical protein
MWKGAERRVYQALVEFKDGCREWIFGYEGFYEYRAYFLAAAGIAEFRECSLANRLSSKLLKWSFGENLTTNRCSKRS